LHQDKGKSKKPPKTRKRVIPEAKNHPDALGSGKRAPRKKNYPDQKKKERPASSLSNVMGAEKAAEKRGGGGGSFFFPAGAQAEEKLGREFC